MTVVAPLSIALGKPTAQAGNPVIMIVAPWNDALAIATSVNGELVAPGRIASVALVASDRSNFIQDLCASGAWFVLNADLSGLFCSIE